MIKYVKEIKANLENLTSLMVTHMDNDRMDLSQKVEDALKRLVRQTLVQKNDDIYVFLTSKIIAQLMLLVVLESALSIGCSIAENRMVSKHWFYAPLEC